MTDRDTYQIVDTDRQDPAQQYYPYYPDAIPADTGQVELLVDGEHYFNDLYATMESLAGDVSKQGIYLMNWLFEKEFEIQPGIVFTQYLRDKARSGVDVRVLIWLNHYFYTTYQNWVLPAQYAINVPLGVIDKQISAPTGAVELNKYMITNLETLEELRLEPNLVNKALANTLNYPAGGAHAKFALVFDENNGIGYTGGMDFGKDRISDSIHYNDSNGWNISNKWHDTEAKVYGEVIQKFFSYYQSLWNRLITLKDNAANSGYTPPVFNHNGNLVKGTPDYASAIPDTQVPVTGQGFQHIVQSLRTLPHKTLKFSTLTPADQFDFSFACNGAYEIQLALKKAISSAETYVYIEDQALYSREILGYLKDRMIARPELKLILFSGLLETQLPQNKRNYTISHYLLDPLTQSNHEKVKDQLGVYSHNSSIVHSKLFLIDDKFVLVGSAGMYNRALFVEMNIPSLSLTRTLKPDL